MSEFIDNQSKRKETLKRLIRQLHEGKRVEEVKEQFEGFGERFEAKSECKKDTACWVKKLSVPEEEWRTKQLAVLWLGELADPNDVATIDAISALLNQGKDKDGNLLGTRNQDVLKAVVIALDKIAQSGCQGKLCDRLKKVVPYFRKKPQYGVLANDSECLLARMLQRSGGKLSDMRYEDAESADGE